MFFISVLLIKNRDSQLTVNNAQLTCNGRVCFMTIFDSSWRLRLILLGSELGLANMIIFSSNTGLSQVKWGQLKIMNFQSIQTYTCVFFPLKHDSNRAISLKIHFHFLNNF